MPSDKWQRNYQLFLLNLPYTIRSYSPVEKNFGTSIEKMLWILIFAKNITQEFYLIVKLRPVHSQIKNAEQQTKV